MIAILADGLTYQQTLVNTIIDKGILAGTLLVVGAWLNGKLEAIRSDLQKSVERFKAIDTLNSKVTADRIEKTAGVWAACHEWTTIVHDVFYDLVADGEREGASDQSRKQQFDHYNREPPGNRKSDVDSKGRAFRTLYVTNRFWTTEDIYKQFDSIHTIVYDCLYSLRSGRVVERLNFNEHVNPLLESAGDSLRTFLSDPGLWSVPTSAENVRRAVD